MNDYTLKPIQNLNILIRSQNIIIISTIMTQKLLLKGFYFRIYAI